MKRWIEFKVLVPFYGRVFIENEECPKNIMDKIESIVQIRAKSHALNFNHAEYELKEHKSSVAE